MESIACIGRLILVTDFRIEPTDDPDELLIVDIDLAVLGAPRGDYDAYRRAIRREYEMVPDDAFRAGRAKVLRHFFERPIYRTSCFERLEAQARGNLAWELQLLNSGEPI